MYVSSFVSQQTHTNCVPGCKDEQVGPRFMEKGTPQQVGGGGGVHRGHEGSTERAQLQFASDFLYPRTYV